MGSDNITPDVVDDSNTQGSQGKVTKPDLPFKDYLKNPQPSSLLGLLLAGAFEPGSDITLSFSSELVLLLDPDFDLDTYIVLRILLNPDTAASATDMLQDWLDYIHADVFDVLSLVFETECTDRSDILKIVFKIVRYHPSLLRKLGPTVSTILTSSFK